MRMQNTKGHSVVLSIQQPFASMLVSGIKQVETRGFDTTFRGEFYIHASGNIPGSVYRDYYLADEDFRYMANALAESLALLKNTYTSETFNYFLDQKWFNKAFPIGCIVGRANLVESIPAFDLAERWGHNRRDDLEREFSLGDLSSDRFAWLIEKPKKFDVPIPMKGCQTIFYKMPENIRRIYGLM